MQFTVTVYDQVFAAQLPRWTWTPSIVVPLYAAGLLYGIGVVRLLRRSNRYSKLHLLHAIPFALGWLSLLIALVSPIHELGEQLFWVHMTQHEILVLISAPLLVLSRPVAMFVWALPRGWTHSLRRIFAAPAYKASWTALTAPLAAWALHAVALWIWHAPVLFDLTLTSDFVHALQHTSFFGSALLFWWALLCGPGSSTNYGRSILYVFTTVVHTSVLGALLTFSQHPWYQPYLSTTAAWRLTPLEDQQLGGLIMWVPAGTILTVIGLMLVPKWLKSSDRRWALSRGAEVVGGGTESS